ncbi:MAG: efflux RND transporter permease subunit [Desulfobacteraceae bacterium]|jgi:predicted RND superfamily exporter protein
MTKIRVSIENGFEAFGYFVYHYRWLLLVFSLVLFTVFASQLPKTDMDTSTVGFFHETDPVRVTYERFQNQFGMDEVVLAVIKPPKLYDLTFFRKLQAFHEELEEQVPHLNEVKSLINVTSTWGKEDELIVEKLMDSFPKNEEGLKAVIKRIRANPIYKRLFISENESVTAVLIRPNAYNDTEEGLLYPGEFETELLDTHTTSPREALSDKENFEFVRAIYNVADKYSSPDFPIHIAGSPAIVGILRSLVKADSAKITLLCFVVIGIFLFILFRRLSGLFLPLIVVAMTLGSTLGIMAFFRAPITPITQVLPAFLLAVGIGDAVHILAIFYPHYHKHNDKEKGIAYTYKHSGLAIVMTSVTTAGSLASFSYTELAPIADLGIYAPIGVMLALLYTLILLPPLLIIIPLKHRKSEKLDKMTTFIDSVLKKMGHIAIDHPHKIVATTTVLVIIAGIGISQLRFHHSLLEWLPQNLPVVKGTKFIDKEMRGSITTEFVIDTSKENGLHEPEIMKKLEEMNRFAESIKEDSVFIGKSTSVVDILKNTHKALNENRDEFHAVPDNKEIIAQELLLFENGGTDDLERIVDTRFSKARITLKFPWLEATRYYNVLKKLEAEVQKIFGTDIKVTHTGIMVLMTHTVNAVMRTMTKSYLISGIVITILMFIVMGNIKLGTIVLFPNFIPIMIGLGAMFAFSWNLNVATILAGSIAIGLVVDDTIHFMLNFQRYYHESHNIRDAVDRTLQTTGRALLFTTLVLSTSFFMYNLASVSNISSMGNICGVIIIVALLADLLLTTALMTIVPIGGKRDKRKYVVRNKKVG